MEFHLMEVLVGQLENIILRHLLLLLLQDDKLLNKCGYVEQCLTIVDAFRSSFRDLTAVADHEIEHRQSLCSRQLFRVNLDLGKDSDVVHQTQFIPFNEWIRVQTILQSSLHSTDIRIEQDTTVGRTEQLGVDLDVVGSTVARLDNGQLTIADALEYTTAEIGRAHV